MSTLATRNLGNDAEALAASYLEKHGYRIHPQGPYFAPHPDGHALALHEDLARRRASIEQFSKHDADAFERWVDLEYRSMMDYQLVLLEPPSAEPQTVESGGALTC